MVSPDSNKVPRASFYLGTTLVDSVFTYGTITLYGHSFLSVLLTYPTVMNRPTTPSGKPLGAFILVLPSQARERFDRGGDERARLFPFQARIAPKGDNAAVASLSPRH